MVIVVVTVIAFGLVAGGILLTRRHRAAQHFTLPGWGDVVVGDPPPDDVELTCSKANEISECHAVRSGGPIQELLVTRRPDALGVLRVMAVGVNPAVLRTIEDRWGTTTPNPHGRDLLWCSQDGKEAASIEEPRSATDRGNVIVSDQPDTWLLDACARRPTSQPAASDATTPTNTPKPDGTSEPQPTVKVLDFVGTCASCEVRGQLLFSLPRVQNDLVRKFGKATLDKLSALNGGPGHIDVVDHDFLGQVVVAEQCMRHDCDAHNMAVFMTPDGTVIGTCIADDGKAEWRVEQGKLTQAGTCFGDAADQVRILAKATVIQSP